MQKNRQFLCNLQVAKQGGCIEVRGSLITCRVGLLGAKGVLGPKGRKAMNPALLDDLLLLII